MSLSAKARRAPLRIAAGAYIVNSGVTKLSVDDEMAKRLHSMASGTYGFLDKVDPKVFAKALAAGEIAVGGALLLPIVPPVVAGAALVGFSGALLNTYWHTPPLHEDGSPRPTQAGTAMAKDVWMFGMGTGMLLDTMLEPAHDKKVELASTVAEKRGGRARRKAKKAAKQARAETRAQLAEMAKEQQRELNKRARKAAKQARKSATETAAQARSYAEDTSKQARKSAAKSAAKAAKKARKSDAVKHARAVAKDASHRVAEAASTAAERAQDAGASARETAQQARKSDAVKHARAVAKDASHRVAEAASAAAERAQDAGASAREAAQHAAERAKQAAA